MDYPINVNVDVTSRTDGYLDVYRGKKQCDWLLTAPKGYSIALILIKETYEIVLAYDGASPNRSSRTMNLPHILDQMVVTSGRHMWLKKVKKTYAYSIGFTVEYSALKQQKGIFFILFLLSMVQQAKRWWFKLERC